MRLIAKMRGMKVKKPVNKTELFRILKRKDKIIYNESPFKSIIIDIKSNLPKRGHKLIKNGLKYAEEMKELTDLQVKSFKENLIKFKNYLVMKNGINNRIKKNFDGYYGKNKFNGVKDIRFCLMSLIILILNLRRLNLMKLNLIILILNSMRSNITTLNLMMIIVQKMLRTNLINFLII